jgi:2,3-bisphosphoglycerate-dependent phosphoglycerate mutase
MNKGLFLLLFLLTACKTTTYYITRHAEKETANTMTSDVPLSAAGKERAEALKNLLKDKEVRYIFTTNYSRTMATAEPLRREMNTTMQLYDAKDTLDRFIAMLRNIDNGNVLIVGHSNTVDDIVNRLTGKNYLPADLPDSAYGDLFVVTRRGSSYSLGKKHFGN